MPVVSGAGAGRSRSYRPADEPLQAAESSVATQSRGGRRSAIVVDRELFDLIARSIDYSRDTDGAFDVTVGPLMKAWGFFLGDGRVPRGDELADVMRHVGYRHVVLDPTSRTIRFDVPEVELDLGGIAKGYAVDRVVALLQQRGITPPWSALAAARSTASAIRLSRRAWDVKIQDPLNPARVAFTVALTDRAISMAGRSAKTFEANGIVYSHIMDPRHRTPCAGHCQRRGDVADRHGRRCGGRCAVCDGSGEGPQISPPLSELDCVVLAAGRRWVARRSAAMTSITSATTETRPA